MKEFLIDRLNHEELKWIVQYFDEYGLWADRASWTPNQKLDYLSAVCGPLEWHESYLNYLTRRKYSRNSNEYLMI